jgi:hypothetical protein
LKRDGKLTFIDEEEILEIGRKLKEMVIGALKGV